MESRQFRLKRLKMQIRLFLPLLFLIFSLVFMGISSFENPYLQQFQTALTQVVTPVVSFVSTPLRWGDKGVREVKLFLKTYQENQRLRAENESLQNWRNIAFQLGSEQQELQRLLDYVPPKKSSSVTARVLADDGGHFSKSFVVSAGSENGVSKGDVAMTSKGVLGRIVEVGPSFSRLMLLTDYLSRVPVVVGNSRVLCMLSGDNSSSPKLVSLPEGAVVQKGDVVLTSGHVGVYPSGLGIGVVSSVNNGEISVSLFESDFTPEFVRLVDFGLNQVLLQEECVEGKNP